MAFLFWDASALAKRYTNEVGRETANALFDTIPDLQHGSTMWSYAETYAILVRRQNGKLITKADFNLSASALQQEVLTNAAFLLLSISEMALLASLPLIRKHNLNSADAVLLRTLLDYAHSPNAPICVMVAVDKRLLRAAQAEGLPTLDPETASVADAALLATL